MIRLGTSNKKGDSMATKYEQELRKLCEDNNLVYEEAGDSVLVETEDGRVFNSSGYHFEHCILDGSSGLSEVAERREAIKQLIKDVRLGFIELEDDETCGNESCDYCYEDAE